MIDTPAVPETSPAHHPQSGPVLDGRRRPSPAAATAQSILSSVGETIYEWDIVADRIRWGGNAAEVLGVADTHALSTGKGYGLASHPDSLTDRHEAVLNGIGVDYGVGVPFDISYALRLGSEADPRTVWVNDRGVWFADGGGKPYLAQGVVRILHDAVARAAEASPARQLPGRGSFLRMLQDILAMAAHYRTAYAFAVLKVGNLPLIAQSYGVAVLEELEAAIGERIRATVRGGDIVGWVSDSEIGLILGVGEGGEAAQAVDRIVTAAGGEAIATSAGPVSLMITAGVVAIPTGASTVERALWRAREALRACGADGFSSRVCHAAEMADANGGRTDADIAGIVVGSLRENRVGLARRPVVNVSDGSAAYDECQVVFEDRDGARLAWNFAAHLVRSLGLSRAIDQLTQPIVLQALRAERSATLALPVSIESLRGGSWLEEMTTALSSDGDLALRLILMVSEAELGSEAEKHASAIRSLRDLGCGVLISEFGAGTQSMRNLCLFGAKWAKLDPAILDAAAAIGPPADGARQVVQAARSAGAEVVAEIGPGTMTAKGLAKLGIGCVTGPQQTPQYIRGEEAAPTRKRGRKVA